jgi:hypothetical protein
MDIRIRNRKERREHTYLAPDRKTGCIVGILGALCLEKEEGGKTGGNFDKLAMAYGARVSAKTVTLT